MKNYQVKKIKLSNNETLAYREGGKGEDTVLFIHGNMSSSIHWETVMEKLENDYRLISVDLRGFGDSTYNNGFNSLFELASDVFDFATLLNLENIVVVGWSTGGGIAMELAIMNPDLVKKVITIGSVPVTGYPLFKKDETGAPILTEPLQTKEEIAADPVQVLPVLDAYKTKNRNFLRLILDHSLYIKGKPTEEEFEAYITSALQQRNLVDVNYALMTFNLTDTPTLSGKPTGRINQLVTPVVMIQGALDPVVPLIWAKASHEALNEKSKLIVIDDAAHAPMTDDLTGFIDLLKRELI